MNELPVVIPDKPEPALLHKASHTINHPQFTNLRELVLLVSGLPLAVVTLRCRGTRLVHSYLSPPLRPQASLDLLCETCLAHGEPIEINQLAEKQALYAGDDPIQYYAGYPLVNPDGQAIGVLSLLDYAPHVLGETQRKALGLMASQMAHLVEESNQKEENKHLDRMLNVSKDLICTVGHDGYFKKINPAFESLLGWDEQYLLRTSLFDLVHRDDIVGTLKEVARLTSGSSITKFTHRIRTRSGTYKFLQWVASPEPDSGIFFAVARDITEEKEKEKKLQISEKNLKSFFENSQGFMCTHDPAGRFISANQAGAAMLGYTVEEMLQLSLFDIVPAKHHTSLKYYLQQINTTGRSNGIMVTQHKNGAQKIWMYNNVLEKGTDGSMYIIGNAIDITERHLLEIDLNRTKEMLEQTNTMARIGGWEFDLLKKRMYWSPITKLIHEVEPDYVPDIERGLDFYKPGESRYKISKAVTAAMQDGTPWDLELQIITAKGRLIWVRSQGRIECENGTCKRMYGAFQDITESVVQQEELRNAKQVAEKASMAKSEFLANMSHEIRTPLNGVIGFTDLVMKTTLTETQRQYLSIVHQSGNSLLNIINDILDFSKIEAGKLELDVTKCDLYELVSQATDIISYQAQHKQLELLLNISASTPRFIWTDPIRLKQVLINLLSNAIKFTDKGEIEIKVEAGKGIENDHTPIYFEVRDTGIGIPLDKQQKIFKAFLQEDVSITRKYGGTGLGLTISNKLLGLMDSHLQVESTPGYGSKFYFELLAKTEHGEPGTWTNGDSIRRVLIIDDNDNNRLIVKQMLLLKQIESDEAKDGFEALNLLARGVRYDVIIVDYHMPYMDGIETIRKIRKNFSDPSFDPKIILLHSSADDELMIKASEELNITSRLAKPIKMQEMYMHLFQHTQKESPSNARAAAIEKQPLHTGPITVLITEDNNANMLLAKTLIKKMAPSARIIEAPNGKEAVKRFQSEKLDIIFMDVQMPVMNGWEATGKIRSLEALEKGNRTPIIALTASNVKGEKEKCLQAGMDDFLSKPFSEEELAAQFTKWTTVEVSTRKQAAPPAEEKASVYFDLQQVIDYLDGDTDFLVEFLDITRKELEASQEDLQKAATAGNLASLNAAAHKLKGTALITGMSKVGNLAKVMEKLPEFHEKVVNDLIEDVRKEIGIVITHIESAKSSL
ncbi:MAG: response regulator [Williamsia sp.]|nr:response regulator [Williamsia sp.]